MAKDQEHIGDRLRIEMERRGLTPARIAEIFDVKAPSVYGWLAFGRIAKKHLPKFVSEFGHSVEWWITGEEAITAQLKGEAVEARDGKVRSLNPREQTMLDLFASLSKDEQEAMIHLFKVRNKLSKQRTRSRANVAANTVVSDS